MLIELRCAEIPVHAFELFETEFVGAKGTVMHARLLHQKPPKNPHRQGKYEGPLNASVAGTFNMAVRPRRVDLITVQHTCCQADPARFGLFWGALTQLKCLPQRTLDRHCHGILRGAFTKRNSVAL